MRHSALFAASVFVALHLCSPDARAEGDLASDAATESSTLPAPPPPARAWLYLDDAEPPPPLHVVAFSRATYAHSESPTRPFGANIARPGGVFELGGEVGATPWLSVGASGFAGSEAGGSMGALAGVHIAPFASRWKTTHLSLSSGYLRELSGGNGAWMRLAFAQDVARARFAVATHGEHVFARGRDALDLMVMAGASYRAVGPLRVGVEYVAQDLEGALDDDAEGGVRHFLGPTAAVELLGQRLTIVGGPSLGLSTQSPTIVGRIALAYAY
jgi:hypothetical protein